jgi:hypothetical protein
VTPEDAQLVVKELMRLPGSTAVCVYDITTVRALACRGDRGMRARQHARMASWALMTATAATARRSEPGEAVELTIKREDRLHTMRLLDPADTPRIVVHLVTWLREADQKAIRSALDAVRDRFRGSGSLTLSTGAAGGVGHTAVGDVQAEPLPWREPGRTWPAGVPAAFRQAFAGRAASRWSPPSDEDRELLDRVLAVLRSDLQV